MLSGYLLLGTVPPLVSAARDRGIQSTDLVLIRFLAASVFVLLLARLTRTKIRSKQPALLILRGVLGACAVQLYFASIQLSGAGIGTLLNYTYPLWANLLGVFFGERPRKSFWIHLLVASCGVLLIVNPQVRSFSQGEFYGLASGVVAGAAVLSVKRLRRTDGELAIVGSFSLIGFVFAVPLALSSPSATSIWSPRLSLVDASLLLGVATLSFLGQLFFTRGYEGTSLQFGTVLSLSVPMVATLLGYVFLDEKITLRFILGAALILLACASLALARTRGTRSTADFPHGKNQFKRENS